MLSFIMLKYKFFFRKIVSRTPMPKDTLESYYDRVIKDIPQGESYYDRVIKDIPQGSYPTYDYSALREFLYPAYQQSKGRRRFMNKQEEYRSPHRNPPDREGSFLAGLSLGLGVPSCSMGAQVLGAPSSFLFGPS